MIRTPMHHQAAPLSHYAVGSVLSFLGVRMWIHSSALNEGKLLHARQEEQTQQCRYERIYITVSPVLLRYNPGACTLNKHRKLQGLAQIGPMCRWASSNKKKKKNGTQFFSYELKEVVLLSHKRVLHSREKRPEWKSQHSILHFDGKEKNFEQSRAHIDNTPWVNLPNVRVGCPVFWKKTHSRARYSTKHTAGAARFFNLICGDGEGRVGSFPLILDSLVLNLNSTFFKLPRRWICRGDKAP